jgi:hypothetical protein
MTIDDGATYMYRLGDILFSAFLCLIVVLPGCDSAGNIVAGIDRGGLRGVQGSVTGFGSVIVNGEHYETDTSAISINGLPATEGDLEVGYVVVIQAELPADGSLPRAVTIDFAHNIIGPLSAVVVAEKRATVLGQSVTVGDSTVYGAGIEPASIDGLAALPTDTILRISGFSEADGGVLATRIDLGDLGSSLEVTGIVENLSLSLQTFKIGGLVINYDSLNLQNFPQLENGDRVNVEGSLGADGVLVANELELEEIGLEVDEGDEFEIEGLVTEISSATEFSVSGITVSIDDQTIFENGDATMLGLDVRVEVEGQFDNGVLKAKEVEFSPEGPLRIEATVDSVNPLQLLGITVQTNNLTIFEDKSPAELRPFSLADIDPADSLQVTGYESLTTPGVVVATGITRTEPLEKLTLRGFAKNVAEPEFSILDILVITDGNTDLEDNFFTIAEGRLVEVQGSTASGSLVAEKVEFED